MTIGTTVDFTVTRDEIITEALELLTVIPPGGTPEAAHVTSLTRTLQMMLKSWQADSVSLTTRKLAYLFPASGRQSYTLNLSGDRYTYDYVKTAVSAAALSGAGTIDVDSVSGIADTYHIGIYQSDGTMHWTTVNGAPAGTTVTLTDVLTADVEEGAVVYCFAANAGRPMTVEAAWIRNEDGVDTEIDVKSLIDYMNQSTKDTQGQVSMVSYDPQIVSPKLHVWPVEDDLRHVVVLLVKRTAYDMDGATDNPDFPQESFAAIATNLAVMAGPKFDNPPSLQVITPIARALYTQYKNYAGKPDQDVTIEIDMEGY